MFFFNEQPAESTNVFFFVFFSLSRFYFPLGNTFYFFSKYGAKANNLKQQVLGRNRAEHFRTNLNANTIKQIRRQQEGFRSEGGGRRVY